MPQPKDRECSPIGQQDGGPRPTSGRPLQGLMHDLNAFLQTGDPEGVRMGVFCKLEETFTIRLVENDGFSIREKFGCP